MRAILDTNVLVSGIFFGGVPRRVLDAWEEQRFELVLSPAIFDEYLRTCARLAEPRPGLVYEEVLATIAGHGTLVADSPHSEPITEDADDDKFMRCARDADAIVVSGDTHLLNVSGWQDVQVLRPRAFFELLADSAAT